jgi:hypothetical protein
LEDGGLGHFHVAAGGNPLCALRPPVVDQTGIKGVFDIKMEGNPDPAMVKNPAENNLAHQFFQPCKRNRGSGWKCAKYRQMYS